MSVSLPIEILRKYKGNRNVFFETGTSDGDSAQTALDAGFSTVYTVELDYETFRRAAIRFEDEPRISVIHGNSVSTLNFHLPVIREPVVFWLDAHPDWSSAASPILEEIGVIRDHLFNDVILADDMRLMGSGKWSRSSIQAITDAVRAKSSEYKVTLEPNGHGPRDLFAAWRD